MSAVRRFHAVRLCSLLLLVAVMAACGPPGGITVSQLGAVQAVLKDVRSVMEATRARADLATARRLDELIADAHAVQQAIDDLIAHGAGRITAERVTAVRRAFGVLAHTRALIDADGRDVLAEIDASLAAMAATLDAIRFDAIPDQVLAISPYKLRRDAADREISIYGYFPSIGSDTVAEVLVDGQRVTARRDIGRVRFDAPATLAAHTTSSVVIGLRLPARGPALATPLEGRLRLVAGTPYAFTIEAQRDSPDAFETVVGHRHVATADAREPERRIHLPAASLFAETVHDPRYDPATAQIVGVQTIDVSVWTSCDDCARASGRVAAWTAAAVDVTLHAPRCDYHVIDQHCDGPSGTRFACPRVCHGGGSRVALTLVPSFTVRVKGAPEAPVLATRRIRAAWQSVSVVPLPSLWTSARVSLVFDDDFDRGETVIVVKRDAAPVALPFFDVRVDHETLWLTTR